MFVQQFSVALLVLLSSLLISGFVVDIQTKVETESPASVVAANEEPKVPEVSANIPVTVTKEEEKLPEVLANVPVTVVYEEEKVPEVSANAPVQAPLNLSDEYFLKELKPERPVEPENSEADLVKPLQHNHPDEYFLTENQSADNKPPVEHVPEEENDSAEPTPDVHNVEPWEPSEVPNAGPNQDSETVDDNFKSEDGEESDDDDVQDPIAARIASMLKTIDELHQYSTEPQVPVIYQQAPKVPVQQSFNPYETPVARPPINLPPPQIPYNSPAPAPDAYPLVHSQNQADPAVSTPFGVLPIQDGNGPFEAPVARPLINLPLPQTPYNSPTSDAHTTVHSLNLNRPLALTPLGLLPFHDNNSPIYELKPFTPNQIHRIGIEPGKDSKLVVLEENNESPNPHFHPNNPPAFPPFQPNDSPALPPFQRDLPYRIPYSLPNFYQPPSFNPGPIQYNSPSNLPVEPNYQIGVPYTLQQNYPSLSFNPGQVPIFSPQNRPIQYESSLLNQPSPLFEHPLSGFHYQPAY